MLLASLEALESGGHGLAAVVEDEAEVDGQVEVDAEDPALDGGAEAECGLEVDEPLQQRAAWLRGRHAHLGLDQAQNIGAHAQLERVAGHLPNEAGVGVGVEGVGVGQSPPQALAMANTTRFTARNNAIEALPAIATEYRKKNLLDH
ncbi:unnamed protein product [Miscanthus lutarioriparius]|uniref:Uncharacterized protein n=1 Tax=Miscanthus lutarioriparius TaxID=422564 RepID=A0A811R0Y1_9POAL|nr:unnamed protein product [Miscanthus lutarioriparius]CAD6262771.1 unnamed protein product [Miscanthus lutarioriparius]CAD6262772.1 unnamed protein product [Miscanthus lutarioriparius]